ncbi:metallophosphoesterase [Neobacillus ginsengisoli]|uniref:MPP superfamily phosphohydrolase n=1 Tax=Neobacillus ginsengisoli TaxID=904295 RepID=A0ABT9XV35_9BACI|nr:metallophosphoesterase [Neobacillus ginsengisoli]MDQ0198762.1 putative MPP superfamily phosphohydrolase [Neobacillus ginsengisoli]
MTESQTERNPINRRTFLKKAGRMSLGLMATGMIMGTYSFKIERFWYQIKEVKLQVKNLPKAFEGWKIVQISDVHLGFHYGVEDFQPVVRMINNLNPDIIFFTGDLIQIGNREPELAIPLLQQLKALRGGKWAVIGNHDFYTKDQVIQVLQNSQFKVLVNNHNFIDSNQQRLYIAGLDDVMYGSPNIGKAVEGLSDHDCVLLLAHEPDIADESSKYPIGAQFSGHSHGGQVRLPFYGPIIRQTLASNYNNGFYQVGESKMPLYVNRGIGTTNIAIRLFCRPEITVFRLTL